MGVLGYSMNIQTFIKLQTDHRNRVYSFMKNIWLRGAYLIMKKFKFFRVFPEKKGEWTLLGFTVGDYTTQDFYEKTVDINIDQIDETQAEEQAELIFGLLVKCIGQHVADQLDMPLSSWCDVEFKDLIDIRDSSAYRFHAMYNGETICFDDNGYKLLNKEVRKNLRISVGILLGLQLRSKVEESLKQMEDMILNIKRITDFEKEQKPTTRSKDEMESDFYEEDASVTYTKNKGDTSSLSKKVESNSMVQKNTVLSSKNSKTGKALTIKRSATLNKEPSLIPEENINLADFPFLALQSNFFPFLRLEILTENNIIKFKDSEEDIKGYFTRWHMHVRNGFKELIHPGFVKIKVLDSAMTATGELKHMESDQPKEKNYDKYYSSFMPKVRMDEKTRKRRVQSILENLKSDDLEERAKKLTVNDETEQEYEISCNKIIEHVVELYRDARKSFSIFDVFKRFFDKTIEKEIKAFIEKENWTMDEYETYYITLKRYKGLLDQVPTKIFFPLFEIDTAKITEHLRGIIEDLKTQLETKYENDLQSTFKTIADKYQQMTNTIRKPINSADEYEAMEKFKMEMVQERIGLQIRSNEAFEKMTFGMKLNIKSDAVVTNAKDVYDGPTNLDMELKQVEERHVGEKSGIDKALKEERVEFEAYLNSIENEVKHIEVQFTNINNYKKIIDDLTEHDKAVKEAERRMEEINVKEQKLTGNQTNFEKLKAVRTMLNPNLKLWNTITFFMDKRKELRESKVVDVDLAELETVIGSSHKKAKDLCNLIPEHKATREALNR